jgi:thiamine-monophosphate kinase
MNETEFGYIKWLQKRLKYSPDVLVGSGDDAAVVKIGKDSQLYVTTDTIVEGIDFYLKSAEPEQIGYKSIAISISDLAAMGGGFSHVYALLSFSAPKRLFKSEFTRPLYSGIAQICKKFNVQLIGGDISSTAGSLTITSTLFGVGNAIKPILRSGAQAGDAILVTGKLGGSILGKHLNFTPRLKEATLLAKKYQINSMIDISDGLLADLNHILEASKTGALIDAVNIPINPELYMGNPKILNRQSTILRHALTDGEDFELLFTAPMKDAVRIIRDKDLKKTGVSIIGLIQKQKGIFLCNTKGKISKVKPEGYTHF